jgi:hypothetical protein
VIFLFSVAYIDLWLGDRAAGTGSSAAVRDGASSREFGVQSVHCTGFFSPRERILDT